MKKAKRRMAVSFVILVLVISAVFAGAFKDWKQIYNNKKQIKTLTVEYQNLLNQEQSLSAEVVKFQDPSYIARYAREKYLYSLPDELIIRIPQK